MLRPHLAATVQTAVTQLQECGLHCNSKKFHDWMGKKRKWPQNSIQPWHPTIARGLRVKYDPGTWGCRATKPTLKPVPSQSQSRRWACSSYCVRARGLSED